MLSAVQIKQIPTMIKNIPADTPTIKSGHPLILYAPGLVLIIVNFFICVNFVLRPTFTGKFNDFSKLNKPVNAGDHVPRRTATAFCGFLLSKGSRNRE